MSDRAIRRAVTLLIVVAVLGIGVLLAVRGARDDGSSSASCTYNGHPVACK